MILRTAKNEERSAIMALYRSVIGTTGCSWDESYIIERYGHRYYRGELLL